MKNGLTNDEVNIARKKYGTNEIIKGKSDSFFSLLIASLGDPIIKILLIALAVKTLFLFKDFDWFETIGIVIAIFLASFISTISEYGSNKVFERMQEEASLIKNRVKRNNVITEVNINSIVVGDIVHLEAGEQIPADGILIDGFLQVNESSLTGETEEVSKRTHDILYRSSVITDGEGFMEVEKVGDKTFYGLLAKEISEKNPETPLKKRLTELAKQISLFGYIGAFIVSFSYLFSVIVVDNHFDLLLIKQTFTNFSLIFTYILHAITLSVTIIVVAVPEGLPMMITLVLSSNMKRMLKNNVLVRKLVGIETAGNINILFTDKTGTITRGSLEVVSVCDALGNVYKDKECLAKNKLLYECFYISMLANNSSRFDENMNILGGNITDRALLGFFNEKSDFKKINIIPFSSKNKYSMTSIKYKNREIMLIKGASEIILDKCDYYIDGIWKKRFVNKKKVNQLIHSYAKSGFRVLALAIAKKGDLKFTFVGLALIKDEIRQQATLGLKYIRGAGIKTIMITGDNIDTARCIGREIGLVCSDNDIILSSDEIDKMSDDEVKKILPNLKIVARSLPHDKSRLVSLARDAGYVVGMTGDGVNDAPALKKADVGFAMGSGAEIAKEASDIVILDNNLLSISNAILYGRCIFKSIRKFIIFQLTVNLCAVSISIIGPFIGFNNPVTVIQMLWINMVMDTFAGLAFAFEPALIEYMEEKPKSINEKIINRYMLGEILFTGGFSALICILFLKLPFIRSLFEDGSLKDLMTAFFGLFIFMSVFNLFNARTNRLNLFSNILKNKVFLVVISFITIVQISLIYFGGNLFRSYGLSFTEFEVMILIAFLVIPIDCFRKIMLRWKENYSGV